MKIEDIKKFKKMGAFQLTEWVLNGEHHPTVGIYINEATGECYQMADKHKIFRKTAATTNGSAAMPYGEWQPLHGADVSL